MKIGRIYKIITAQSNECYIGSTFNTIRDRFSRHRNHYKYWKLGRSDRCSAFILFDKYGLENCKIVLIKEYEVVDRSHLEVYESLWIYKLKSVNEIVPKNSLLKKEQVRRYNKQYRTDNKEQIKEYREQNKKQIQIYQEQYRIDNKEQIKEQRKLKIECKTCNCNIIKYNIKRHLNTEKHLHNEQLPKQLLTVE